MKTRFSTFIAAAALLFAAQSNAVVIAKYKVDNYNNGNAKHGLWTNGDYLPDNTFSINKKTFFELDDTAGVITGRLYGSASNDVTTAKIDLHLSDFRETYAYKQEGGIAWNPGLDGVNDIDFFAAMKGTIEIDGLEYQIGLCEACGYGFQFGLGANSKNPNELGGASWIANQFHTGTGHWDLNLSFKPVPEPGTMAILAIGILGLVASRRNIK